MVRVGRAIVALLLAALCADSAAVTGSQLHDAMSDRAASSAKRHALARRLSSSLQEKGNTGGETAGVSNNELMNALGSAKDEHSNTLLAALGLGATQGAV